ncbi:MAG: hypothetical protein E7287_10980, partial [Lachnospiraceae bacterium]|nr:hypothetical protein [Lachnospiraceae bacterium]
MQETLEKLNTDERRGLSEAEAARRFAVNGPNEMKEARQKTWIENFLEQLNDPLIYVLMVAAAVSVF